MSDSPELEKLASIVYQAYADSLGISSARGYKPWDQLQEQRRGAWKAVARVVPGPTGPLAREGALPVDEDGDLPEFADLADFRHRQQEWEFIGDLCRSHKDRPQDQRLLSSRQVQVIVRMIEGEWGEQK